MLIYDCSNSPYSPSHRNQGGPVENEVVRLLKKAFTFTPQINEADLFFTNDVYPPNLPSLPKIKRMDGIFWQEEFLKRNQPYNQAALESDFVIFISEYSKNSFSEVIPCSVILNWVDDSEYPRKQFYRDLPTTAISACTNWSREEKRLGDVLALAKMYPEITFNLMGACDFSTPLNVVKLGYIDSIAEKVKYYHRADFFVNLSHRDAAPKVVAEAICCGLPVFYANSGGTPELVTVGLGVEDPEIGRRCYPLNNLEQRFSEFLSMYPQLSERAIGQEINRTEELLRGFGNVFESQLC